MDYSVVLDKNHMWKKLETLDCSLMKQKIYCGIKNRNNEKRIFNKAEIKWKLEFTRG